MAADKIHPINPYAQIFSQAYTSRTGKKSELSQFSELMMSMMAGNSFGMSSEPGGASNLNTMMMPLMLSLLEKIQSMQINNETGPRETAPQAPVSGGVISQEYHAGHFGLDFAVVEGTPVKATMSGKVAFAGWNDQGYGNLVIIENGSKKTYYAHLSEIPVDQGEWIRQGEVIGLSGNTGNSTGPHLHYEIRINGQTIDPTKEVFG